MLQTLPKTNDYPSATIPGGRLSLFLHLGILADNFMPALFSRKNKSD